MSTGEHFPPQLENYYGLKIIFVENANGKELSLKDKKKELIEMLTDDILETKCQLEGNYGLNYSRNILKYAIKLLTF